MRYVLAFVVIGIQLSITRKGEEGPEGPDGDEIAADESETTGEEEGGGLW